MNNTINGNEVLTIPNDRSVMVLVDTYSQYEAARLQNINEANTLHVHYSLTNIEQWLIDLILSAPGETGSVYEMCGIVIVLKLYPNSSIGYESSAFKIYNTATLDMSSYVEGECIRIDIPLETLRPVGAPPDSPPLYLSDASGFEVEMIMATKLATTDENTLSLNGVLPDEYAELIGIVGYTGTGFELNIHDMYFSNGVNVIIPEHVSEQASPPPESNGEWPIKDYDCSLFTDSSYEGMLHEYVTNLPETLTFEFFHSYLPSNTVLLDVGNLQDGVGFNVEVSNVYDNTQTIPVGIRIKIKHGTNNEYVFTKYNVNTDTDNHVIVELNKTPSSVVMYYNKENVLEYTLSDAQAVAHNGNPLHVEVLKNTFNIDNYLNSAYTEDGDLFLPSSIPDIQTADNWENLYVLVSSSDYTNDYSDYGVTDFSLATIKNGQERYAPEITSSSNMIILKNHTTRSYYYDFNEQPIVVQIMLNIENARDINGLTLRIEYENTSSYFNVRAWNMPSFDHELGVGDTEVVVVAIPLEDMSHEDVGYLQRVYISDSSYGGPVRLVDMLFCTGSGRVYPTPLYKETPW